MRLSVDQVRQAILHPDWDVRDMALRYFQESFSTDPAVMPLLIEAVEKYGWAEAFSPAIRIQALGQTTETVAWLVEQLKMPSPDSGPEPLRLCWTRFLSWQLCAAPVELLIPREAGLHKLMWLDLECREIIEKRLATANMDAQTGWRELQAFAENSANDYDPIEFADDDFKRFSEVIIRGGDRETKRVLDLLDEPVGEFYDEEPQYWMQTAAIHLAGYLQLQAAIPRLIELLEYDVGCDGQWLCYRCVDALIRIGSDDVIRAVAERFPQGSWDFRAVTSRIFDGIHSESAVREGLALMAGEADDTLRVFLADGLLNQFDEDVVEAIRNLILRGECHDDEDVMIRQLVAVATVMDLPIPESEPWRERAKAALAEHRREIADRLTGDGRLPDDWDDEFDDDLEDEDVEGKYGVSEDFGESAFIHGKPDNDRYVDDDDLGEFVDVPQVAADDVARPFVNSDPKVGRNDPCPCGSGKKFKRCCMNREKNPPKIDW